MKLLLDRLGWQIISLILPLLAVSALGQQFPPAGFPTNQARPMFGPPLFLYDTFYFLTPDDPDKYRLDIYITFANDILQFVKEKQGDFTASYDLYLNLLDHKHNQIADKLVSSQIRVDAFEATNDRELKNQHHLSFKLVPGKYRLVLDLTDHDTQKSLHREKEINIGDLDLKKTSLSDVIFANQVLFDSLRNVKEIIPNLERNFTDPRSACYAYFEIYPSITKDNIKFSYTIADASEQAIMHREQQLSAKSKTLPYLVELSKNIKEPGRYALILQVEQHDEKITRQAKFSVNWSNFEFSRLNIKTAIEALKNFIPDKELHYIEQASDSAKEVWFNNFWKERDPVPETEDNELKREFYRRVDFSNNYFTVNALDKEGWKTDRGNIYIKYGPPTDVERHLDQLNLPPYEIWYYEKLERRFFFEDKSGVGDFQLVRME